MWRNFKLGRRYCEWAWKRKLLFIYSFIYFYQCETSSHGAVVICAAIKKIIQNQLLPSPAESEHLCFSGIVMTALRQHGRDPPFYWQYSLDPLPHWHVIVIITKRGLDAVALHCTHLLVGRSTSMKCWGGAVRHWNAEPMSLKKTLNPELVLMLRHQCAKWINCR